MNFFGYFLCIKTKKVTNRELKMKNKKHKTPEEPQTYKNHYYFLLG